MNDRKPTTLWILTSDGQTHSVKGESYTDKEVVIKEFNNMIKNVCNSETMTFEEENSLSCFFTKHIVSLKLTWPRESEE